MMPEEFFRKRKLLKDKAKENGIEDVEERIIEAFNNYQIAFCRDYKSLMLIKRAMQYGIEEGEEYYNKCMEYRK